MSLFLLIHVINIINIKNAQCQWAEMIMESNFTMKCRWSMIVTIRLVCVNYAQNRVGSNVGSSLWLVLDYVAFPDMRDSKNDTL